RHEEEPAGEQQQQTSGDGGAGCDLRVLELGLHDASPAPRRLAAISNSTTVRPFVSVTALRVSWTPASGGTVARRARRLATAEWVNVRPVSTSPVGTTAPAGAAAAGGAGVAVAASAATLSGCGAVPVRSVSQTSLGTTSER